MRRCAFLTMRDHRDFVIDDDHALAPLRDLGWLVDTLPWDKPGVAWDVYEVVVLRSTWDYHERPDAFLDRLAEIESSGTRLQNSLATVRWNMQKSYLRDLAERGVPTVPTVFLPQLGAGQLPALFAEVGSDEIVVKPVVGASSHGAYRLARQSAHEWSAEVEAYFDGRALMAQPLVRGVLEEGEYSLFYFEGELSHAILKTPVAGDFRSQEEHGAALRAITPNAGMRSAGAQALGALDAVPLYARIDFVRANDDDSYWLMELELIEPSLYFRMDAQAPARFATALNARLSQTSRG